MLVAQNVIMALAGASFESRRSARFRGDGHGVKLEAFPEEMRTSVTSLYALLGELRAVVTSADAEARLPELGDRIARVARPSLAVLPVADEVAEALHDVRGGALTALVLGLHENPHRAPDLGAIALLVKDHMKIMRNVIEDLDPAQRARDAMTRPHSLATLAATLQGIQGSPHALDVHVHVDAGATIAESCLETAALERAIFNLFNNAARHAADGTVDVWLLVIGAHLRAAVVNRVKPDESLALTRALESDPAVLFSSFTSTGSGLGLGIVADIIGSAYGLDDAPALVADGYLGTRLVEPDMFVGWLHWPLSSMSMAPPGP